MNPAIILAAMLKLGEPGISDGSRVVIEGDCAEDCSAYWDRHGTSPVDGIELMRASWSGWTRRETRQEALTRWVVIARAAATVVESPPPAWRGTGRQLWRGLVTIMRHESAFWGAVHDGTLRGAAGEACLVQVHPVNFARLGVSDDGAELVGAEIEPTVRCLYAGAVMLAQARAACGADGPGWFDATIGLYGAGNGCNVTGEWVSDRVQTYARTGGRRSLPFDARLALMHVGGQL